MSVRELTPLEAARFNRIMISAPDYAKKDYVSSVKSNVKSNWYVGQDSVGVTTQAATPGYSGSFGDYIVARKDRVIPNVEKVIFNPPATVVIWDDGTKTVVKAKESGRKKSDKDAFSEEYGLAMAVAKKFFGSRSAFLKAVKNAKRPGAE